MSNKIVPAIYRAVIDDVISSIKSDFDEYGVSEDVLAELQSKWENKVIASHVAEFEAPPPAAPPQYPHHHMMVSHPHYHNPYAPPPPPVVAPGQPHIKSEPIDSRYILGAQPHYAVAPLPGPQIPGLRQPSYHPVPAARPPGNTPTPVPVSAPARPYTMQNGGAVLPPQAYQPPPPHQPQQQQQQQQQQPQPQRIPQVDGPSSSGSESPSPSPPQYAPRSSHPSLPQPVQQSPSKPDDEAINSDLDDSDSEGEDDPDEGGPGETDIVFCTYDKVARVKNKWKCILKDGMIHINGKDYLFAKCTGEFEW